MAAFFSFKSGILAIAAELILFLVKNHRMGFGFALDLEVDSFLGFQFLSCLSFLEK